MQLKRNKEMEFETLKKNYKKQIIIGALAICVIGGALTFNLTKAKYRVDGSIDLAKGTINYKPYDFKIMAMYKSDDKTNYTEIDTMPSEGYVINESKSYCNMSDGNKNTNVILKTIDGNHTIAKLKKNDRCYLYFDKKTTETIRTILGEIEVNISTPNFSQIADTDEGIFVVEDGMYGGYSYYWRGAATTNYIMFANKCWRIVRINGDGTIRLIYDGSSCHINGTKTINSIALSSVEYNTVYEQSNYVGWTYEDKIQRTTEGNDSNAKAKLESWFSKNLLSYSSKIADGKYCNDRDTSNGYIWEVAPSKTFYYAGYTRLYVNYAPTLNCNLGDIYTLKIGLITADEVEFAGGKNTDNNSYYLYNGQTYWTMSPNRWNTSGTPRSYVFNVGGSGNLGDWYVYYTSYGLRPVINLRSDITFSGGDGTLNNPYIVAD